MAAKSGEIRVGIGGWTFEPWRGVFYPKGLPQAQELDYASQHLTSIEINGTYYGTQKPESFRKWAREVAGRLRVLGQGPALRHQSPGAGEAGDSIKCFLDSGVLELGDRSSVRCCGNSRRPKNSTRPISAASWTCCRDTIDDRRIRHVVEVRHDSFRSPAFVALARKFSIPVVFADHAKYPGIADLAGDFVYARLQKGDDKIETAYPLKDIDAWTARARTLGKGRRA